MTRPPTPEPPARRVDAERNRERIRTPRRFHRRSPGAVLTAWLRRVYVYFTGKRFVASELLEHTDRDDPGFGAGRARVLDAGRPLVLAAQKSGQIRVDLTLEQLLDMIGAIAKVPGDSDYREPILKVTLDAIWSVTGD